MRWIKVLAVSDEWWLVGDPLGPGIDGFDASKVLLELEADVLVAVDDGLGGENVGQVW